MHRVGVASFTNFNLLSVCLHILQVANPSKYRVDLRFFAELISVGVLSEKAALEALARQLQTLAAMDKDEHNNASIIQSFCKHCGNDYAGLVPRKYRLIKTLNFSFGHSAFCI